MTDDTNPTYAAMISGDSPSPLNKDVPASNRTFKPTAIIIKEATMDAIPSLFQ